jgi:hypothetical protein
VVDLPGGLPVTMAVILAALAAFTHYVYGGLQLANRGRDTTRAALVHLSVARGRRAAAGGELLAGALRSVAADLAADDRHAIHRRQRGAAHQGDPRGRLGHVRAMFLSVVWTRSWRLPVIGTVLLVVVSVVVGGIFPALIQSLKVKPSELSLESPYLSSNIEATRAAYGLDTIKVTPYDAKTTVERREAARDRGAIPGIRLVDPIVVPPTFRQLQALRNYYAFPDALDVDRYTDRRQESDVVVACANSISPASRGTAQLAQRPHGLHPRIRRRRGLRQPRGRTATGLRESANIPPAPATGPSSSRGSTSASSRRSTRSSARRQGPPARVRLPRPGRQGRSTRPMPAGRGADRTTSCAGCLCRQVPRVNFLLSDAGQRARPRDPRHRTPKERVQRVAPWLTLDGNPYPAIVDGRVVWIVDGYTTTANYPNSALQMARQATSDSRRPVRSVTAWSRGRSTTSATRSRRPWTPMTGRSTSMQWDEPTRVLRPGWGLPGHGPAAERDQRRSLMSHLRYPEDLFKIQRLLLSRYHVTDAEAFYGGKDFWRVPERSRPRRPERPTSRPTT